MIVLHNTNDIVFFVIIEKVYNLPQWLIPACHLYKCLIHDNRLHGIRWKAPREISAFDKRDLKERQIIFIDILDVKIDLMVAVDMRQRDPSATLVCTHHLNGWIGK